MQCHGFRDQKVELSIWLAHNRSADCSSRMSWAGFCLTALDECACCAGYLASRSQNHGLLLREAPQHFHPTAFPEEWESHAARRGKARRVNIDRVTCDRDTCTVPKSSPRPNIFTSTIVDTASSQSRNPLRLPSAQLRIDCRLFNQQPSLWRSTYDHVPRLRLSLHIMDKCEEG